ncbi:thiamine pyrophosphate-binding protein [Agathobaculum sp. Marseille-P7918]|uniref:thiamine pyrophosphate-binding protein n=1 Tax=Agathobaculum sp. Marseille-P7918 TaxID=2479843 RepID=UPI0035674282
MKLSDYVIQFLKDKGVDQCFLLPGGGAMHLVDSVGRNELPYVCFQHEQGAAIAAEAYGQHQNRPALLLVTSGPGATNAITGVTAGWIDSTPMFVISGQAKRSDLIGDTGVRQIGSQEVQTIDMVRSITKYAVEVMEPKEIRYHLERAWHEATSNRPGPVWLSIPLDVQGAQIEENDLCGFSVPVLAYVDLADTAERCVQLLKESRKPLLLAGNGIKLSGAEDALFALLQQLPIPVQTTWKSIDLMGEDHPLYVGHPGIMGDRGANLILQEADLLLSVGSRLDTSLTAFDEPHFAKYAKRIIVDIDSNELNRMHMEKEIALAIDAGAFLKALCDAWAKTAATSEITASWSAWLSHAKQLRAKYPVVTEEHRKKAQYVSPYYFTELLCQKLDARDVIVPESSGGAGEITYQAFQLKHGQKMKNAAGLGSMGFGLPYAIGSCIANHGHRTILINGDGAFQLNIQELETLHRLNLPVKMFIWCNDGYGSIRNMQNNNFGMCVASGPDSGYTVPDVCAVARAYGFSTYTVHHNHELVDQLPAILEEEGPSLCAVWVDPEETVSPRVKAFPQPDGSMKSGALEDMWPKI